MKRNLWLISTLIAAIAIVLIALVFAGPSDKATYVGVKKCKMCHPNQNKTYEQMGHATAWDKLSADEKKKADCVKCHVTGYGKPGGFSDDTTTPDMVNVQCESCHGPGSEHIKAAPDQKKTTINREPGAICVTCHNPHVRFGKKPTS